MNIESVAVICHQANKSYCEVNGDFTQLPWELAPNWQQDSAIKGVEFHLKSLSSGQEPNPAASHENWMKQKTEEGWTYGSVKDVTIKTHPCYLPYDKLPPEQKAKDFLFCSIVSGLFHAGVISELVTA